MNDTIAAIATATGIGSVAIVRMSGPQAITIASKVTQKRSFKPRYAHLCTLYDHQGAPIDEAIVLWFQAPRSFTTEEVVELQCHGGIIVAEKILHTLLHHGARLAQPGEFTKRAFLGGRIDLSEAEAIAKLIEAKSEKAADILVRQMKGEIRDFVAQSREALMGLIAHAEVAIDYAEEDLPEDLHAQMLQQLDHLQTKIDRILQSSRRRQGMIEGFKVSIVGKPNVGKSSLLNALLSYDRAIVSDIAGTTRDTIEEQIRIDGYMVRIVDTAGLREAQDHIEKIGIERTKASIEESDIVIALFDASSAWEEEDSQLLDLLRSHQDKKIIVALSKCDLPRAIDTSHLSSISYLELTQDHRAERILEALRAMLDSLSEGEEILLSTTRQIEALQRTHEALALARAPLQEQMLELFSFHLNEAIQSLGTITRPVDYQEIMDHMFSQFCLGK